MYFTDFASLDFFLGGFFCFPFFFFFVPVTCQDGNQSRASQLLNARRQSVLKTNGREDEKKDLLEARQSREVRECRVLLGLSREAAKRDENQSHYRSVS